MRRRKKKRVSRKNEDERELKNNEQIRNVMMKSKQWRGNGGKDQRVKTKCKQQEEHDKTAWHYSKLSCMFRLSNTVLLCCCVQIRELLHSHESPLDYIQVYLCVEHFTTKIQCKPTNMAMAPCIYTYLYSLYFYNLNIAQAIEKWPTNVDSGLINGLPNFKRSLYSVMCRLTCHLLFTAIFVCCL